MLYAEQYKNKIENENNFHKDLIDHAKAEICSVIANSAPFKKKGSKPIAPKDFLWKKEKQKMSVQQIETMLKAITLAMEGEVNC